jgi:co-chaperonin GroES (HSP10)
MLEVKDIGKFDLVYDTMLVRILDDESNSWDIKDKDGNVIKLVKDSWFSVMRSDYVPDEVLNICFKGEVVKMPRLISPSKREISVDVSEGDICYFHHSLCDPENVIRVNGEDLYRIDYKVNYLLISYTNVYLKLCKDNLETIDKWVLVEPIEEVKLRSENLILINDKKKSDKFYRVLAVKPGLGINVGEEIVTERNYVKEINVNKKLTYVVDLEHILAKR